MKDVVLKAVERLQESQERREKAQKEIDQRKATAASDEARAQIKNMPYCRNELAFNLARFLQGANIEFDNSYPYAEEYWRQINKKNLNKDANSSLDSFEDFMEDLETSWDAVKCPDGKGLQEAIKRAKESPTPVEAKDITNRETRLLASICRELQLLRPKKKFRFTQDLAGKAIGRNRDAGARKLALLEKRGIITRTFIGRSGFASEYVYNFSENSCSKS